METGLVLLSARAVLAMYKHAKRPNPSHCNEDMIRIVMVGDECVQRLVDYRTLWNKFVTSRETTYLTPISECAESRLGWLQLRRSMVNGRVSINKCKSKQRKGYKIEC